jgi:acetamidase/formamidase
MQTFTLERARTHCVGAEWPEFIGSVSLGESFVVETEESFPNGPIAVAGVKAGEAIAVRIEAIGILPPFNSPNGGPFDNLPGVPLEYRDGYFYWPSRFRLKAKPSVGNVAILPAPTREVLELSREMHHGGKRFRNKEGWRRLVRAIRGMNCHQDCGTLSAGTTIQMKAQVDGAGLCLDDVHGYIGQGEVAFAGIEVKARVQVRVERSTGWLVDWPLIETPDEIMVFCGWSHAGDEYPRWKYVDVVREALRALREVVSAKAGCTVEDANSIVVTAADVRNCAIYGLGEGYIATQKDAPPNDLAVVAALRKDVFV